MQCNKENGALLCKGILNPLLFGSKKADFYDFQQKKLDFAGKHWYNLSVIGMVGR